MEKKKIRIHAVFIGKPQWEAGWPYLGYDPGNIQGVIIDRLVGRFPGVEFSRSDMITTLDKGLNESIKGRIDEMDALLVFTIGHYGDPGLISSGADIVRHKRVPTILANVVYHGDHTFTKLYTSIKDEGLQVYPLSSKDISDFDGAIGLLCKILALKGEKVIVYASDTRDMDWTRISELLEPEMSRIAKTAPGFFDQVSKMKDAKFEFYTDLDGFDQAHQWRKDEKGYAGIVEAMLGVRIQRNDPADILRAYDATSADDAKSVAALWQERALSTEPAPQTVVNSARLHLAMRRLLDEAGARFMAPDCGTLLLIGRMPAYPCLGFFEMASDGYYGICESDLDATVSYMIGWALTGGRPGFVSNHAFDLTNNQVTYLHCVAPCCPEGQGGPRAGFDIVHHGETGILGASPRVKYPVGEPLTTVKVSVFERKLALYLGKVVGNSDEKGGCVTKVVVQVKDARALLDGYDWPAFGWHRVSFVGDWCDEFRMAARLLGLQLVDYSDL
ncbi:MAG: hypothetical protein JW839_17075 [Candidatus Lokiarchaeota archaeon]|nr:hypothetical protein [Candidatus Lokiarchaeota archaeon]